MDRYAFKKLSLIAVISLAACGVAPENDPIYLSLKANPPKEIPERHLPKLRKHRSSCDVFNPDQPNQYMTCWTPVGFTNPPVANLQYYGPRIINPSMDMLGMGGGINVSDFLVIR